MSHKFNPDNRHKLDNPERRKLLPPAETLCRLGLQAGDVMADIGCGIGYFTLPAAKIVGSQGKVYALDISVEMLNELRNNTSNLANIELIQVRENDFILDNESVNFALVCLVAHEVEDCLAFFQETARLLKPKGKIVIIEWINKQSMMGLPMEHRLDEDEVIALLKQCTFMNVQRIAVNSEMYAVIGEKI
ncbi:MAG: ubiE 3 [Firmicutes bacterium]|nr:ubiE 3 [Bacillota bacterium]